MTTQLDQVLQALTTAVTQIQVSQQSSDNLAQHMSQNMASLAIRQEMQDQQRAQDLQALSTSVQVLGQQNQASARLRARLFETKGFLKPPSYSGNSSDWKDWKFRMVMWMDSENLFAKKLLQAVEEEESPVSGTTLPPDVRNDPEAKDGRYASYDKDLSIILTQLCSAGSIPMEFIRMSEEQSGLEVWRRMCRHYEPKSIQATMSLVPSVFSPQGATLHGCV